METLLLASSKTKEDLIKIITNYLFGSTITIDGENVYNKKGLLPHYRVIEKKGVWRFEQIMK